jgi:hypothetical protein
MKRSDDQKRAHSAYMKGYHASRTPEERAAWREQVSLGTAIAMLAWHARRTPEQRDQTRQRQSDAAVCRMFLPHQPGTKLQKGQRPVASPDMPALRALSRVQSASVKRILKEIVTTDPDLMRDAIIEGLQAPPPRSFPYIALAAAYLDGKPVNGDPPNDGRPDLSNFTNDELVARALAVATHLRQQAEDCERAQLPVIDVTPVPEKK